MAYINIKPWPGTVHETEDQALAHLFLHKKQQDFTYGTSFGQSIEERRKVTKAMAEKNASAFKASRRKGYWRIDLI
jgi:hypothetical protein